MASAHAIIFRGPKVEIEVLRCDHCGLRLDCEDDAPTCMDCIRFNEREQAEKEYWKENG